MKQIVGAAIAERVRNGETIAVGTGSTVDAAISAIADRVNREKLQVAVVPTSLDTAWKCEALGLTVLSATRAGMIEWGFDGADEVSPTLDLIKGRGGAMLLEKIVAAQTKHFIAIVDESKLVSRLGEKVAVPVEVVAQARFHAERELARLGASTVTLREGVRKYGAVITELGNIILDATFPVIDSGLEGEIKKVVGVVESGLFVGFAKEAWIASATGVRKLQRPA